MEVTKFTAMSERFKRYVRAADGTELYTSRQRKPDTSKDSKLKSQAPIDQSKGWDAYWYQRELKEVAAAEARIQQLQPGEGPLRVQPSRFVPRTVVYRGQEFVVKWDGT